MTTQRKADLALAADVYAALGTVFKGLPPPEMVRRLELRIDAGELPVLEIIMYVQTMPASAPEVSIRKFQVNELIEDRFDGEGA